MKLTTTEFENRTDLIEANYPGQNPRMMSVYMLVDWDEKTVEVETRNYQIGGTPLNEWLGRIWSFTLPSPVDALEIRDYITEEIIPVLEQVEDKYDTQWDGSNWVPDWGEVEIDDIRYQVKQLVDGAPTLDEGGLWDAGEWFQNSQPLVTAATTDAELKELAAELEMYARGENVILDGLEKYLYELREEKRFEEME